MCVSGTVVVAAATWAEWVLQPSSWWVILQVAAGLGFVIFVHELGHFLVAKACGVKCEKFFLGFDVGGLKLLSFTWGETEYGIGVLPLGGYVKMLGQHDNPAAAANEAQRARTAGGRERTPTSGDQPSEPVDALHAAWDPRSYQAQSVPERMAIISAGVIMNVIFAVLMATLAYGLGVREMTCAISSVRTGGAAWRAGLRTGDEIIAIGGRHNPIFNDLRHRVTVGDIERGIEFVIWRPADDTTRTVLLKPDLDLGTPTIGVTSPFSLTLPADFGKGLPGAAARAEPAFEPGDAILTADGEPVETYANLLAVLTRKPAATITIGVDRRGADGRERVEIALPPQRRRVTGLTMAVGPVKAVQADSPAAAAGIERGDLVSRINGEPVGNALTLNDRLAPLFDRRIPITVSRGGQERELTVEPRAVTWRDDETTGRGCPVSVSSLGIALEVSSLVADVAAGSPAALAGIVPGERIVRATFLVPGQPQPNEGVPLTTEEPNWPAVVSIVQQLPVGTRLRLDVESAAGKHRDVDLEPTEAEDLFVSERGLVFEPVYRVVRAGSLGEAFRRGGRKAWEDLSLVYSFLGKLTSSKISPRLLGGPIEIAKQAGKSAEEGFGRLLLFLTMLSANLAVVNFLPIPVLDGGHMVFLLYELVRGKPPGGQVVGILSYLGLALILTLMMFVFGLDLGLIPRR
ncbi:MAG: PDZ domain-containing protein [Planctomycetes bacterium]|nr:PDZ domain-containing protein [Planctomycetota bacterium]MBM4057051.1 PDZ domain-containing protein [Planctomycetota bacterium]